MQRALVTGAAGGLGVAFVKCFQERGMDVLAPGRDALDVVSAESIKDYFAAASDIDLLVCNAGVIADRSLARMTEDAWDHVIDVNLKGAFLCAREVARGMMKRRYGHIVFVSSFSALHPPVGQVNYSAAKAALLGMMKSMAQEMGSRNIRVNAIVPGFLETKMTAGLSDEVREASRNRHVLGRFNTPEAVAEFVAHLDSQMVHTSGQVFNLDSRIV